jgi:hypothetical protein
VNNHQYQRLLRTLLLPINLKLESACVDVMPIFFNQVAGDVFEDHVLWLKGQIEEWHESGCATEQLTTLVQSLLKAGNSDYADIISEYYFVAHTELIEHQLVDFELSRSFLSHLLLIVRLTDEEKMSCAQISKILDAMNPSAGFGRRSVEAILKKMKIAPGISKQEIIELSEQDKLLITEVYGDASLQECIARLANVASSLGFKGNMLRHLTVLINEDDVTRFNPYVQILHYQCAILEFYDHDVKDFYEFSPRGAAAGWLFNHYPRAMVNASNPFLNNAKSVGQINFPWAAAKKNKEFAGAAALFTVLDGLDEMGYAARNELALWIRCLIHRFMICAEPLDTPLPNKLSGAQYAKVIAQVAAGNTATRGIIEQRLVDALSVVMHQEADGWTSRGIGDAVNASNLSKKKLGDCDFQHIALKKVVAYEAHGGTLTKTYLQEHLKTLPKVARPRIEEWKTYSNVNDWQVEIVFVAHAFNVAVPADFILHGVHFSVSFFSYEQMISRTDSNLLTNRLNQLLLTPLSANKTPSFVRQAFIQLLTS